MLLEPATTSDPAAELNSVQGILSAATSAAEKHAGQKRKGAAAEPYVNHVLEVAQLVSTPRTEPDTNLIIASLLHGVNRGFRRHAAGIGGTVWWGCGGSRCRGDR